MGPKKMGRNRRRRTIKRLRAKGFNDKAIRVELDGPPIDK